MDVLSLAAALSIMMAILLFAMLLASGGATREMVRGRLEGIIAGGGVSVVEASAEAALREDNTKAGLLQQLLSGAWLGKIQEELHRADSQLQPADFIAIRTALAVVGFTIPLVFLGGALGLVAAIIVAAIGFQVPKKWISNRSAARSKKLEEQLPEALTLIANSLKSGFGLLQSLSLAAEQLEHPISTELATTIHEMSVGSSAEEALTNLSERVGNYDLDLVVTAILVQRSVGGSLAEILSTVAETMRERVRIRGDILTLTSQQRLTGMVVGGLPIVVGGLFLIVSPDYIMLLFTENVGRMLLVAAVVLELIGMFIMNRILAIEV